MENQDIDLIGQTVGNLPYKLGIVDQNGNLKNQFVAKASTNRIDIPEQFLSGSGSTGGSTGGGNTGGGDNPDHPSAGADYYAGSLADGEITERYLLYKRDESVAEQASSQTVTLLRDVGTKFNMAGEGATILAHVQKTAMDKGTKGAVTDIELNYDPNNVAKDGYFTTTSPYPFYIKSGDLATLKALSVPLNGIGENLSGKNVKAPQLNVTFNGDRTMTLESVTGYDNDGATDGATGANYEIIVDVVATFSTQTAVAQIPASVNFFTGNTIGSIALAGMNNFFENSMDGIEITYSDYLIATIASNSVKYIKLSDIGLSNSIVRISKNELIIGNSLKIVNEIVLNKTINWYNYTNGAYTVDIHTIKLSQIESNQLKFDLGSIDADLNVYGDLDYGGYHYNFQLPVLKVTSYKE